MNRPMNQRSPLSQQTQANKKLHSGPLPDSMQIDGAHHTYAGNVPLYEEEEYRMIAEAIPQIVWTARPDGYNDYFNQRWFEYTGLSPEQTYDPVNQGWPDYEQTEEQKRTVSVNVSALYPDDVARYMREWKQALVNGTSYEIEYRFRRASDGMYRWHLGRATPIRDREGNIIKWFGTCTDIHDQKQAQEQMRNLNKELERNVEERMKELQAAQEKDRANLQRLREMIHSLPMGAVALDEEDTILHYNERFLTLFHLNHSSIDLIGRKGRELREMLKRSTLHPERYLRLVEHIIANRKTRLSEEIHMTDGRILARDHMPIFDQQTYRGYLLLYRDITQEKRIDTSKSEFMSLASHQLRTPLTTIRWTLGRLDRRLAALIPPTEAHLLHEGKKAASRMADTIDTMLAISRIEAGKVKLDISHVLVCKLMHEVIHNFEEEYQQKHLRVTFECLQQVEIQTDAKFLHEILSNLLSNAVKYTPEHGSVAIRIQQEEEGMRIDIEDSGYGIPAHQQEKIFSKFFRGDNVLQHDTNGTGLGLYLVYLLTGILRGTVHFRSTEEVGTTFTLTLPRNFYTIA